MNTPNFTSLLTALRAFVLKSRPAYRDYLGTESVEEKTVLLTGTLSATGESVTAADGFTGFTDGQTYKAAIGEETVEVTAQYGTGSFSECIVIGSSNVAPSDTIPGWMVCVYNENLLGFGTGDWAGKQIEVATSKMVPVEKWDVKKLPEECLPEKMPEKWAEELDTGGGVLYVPMELDFQSGTGTVNGVTFAEAQQAYKDGKMLVAAVISLEENGGVLTMPSILVHSDSIQFETFSSMGTSVDYTVQWAANGEVRFHMEYISDYKVIPVTVTRSDGAYTATSTYTYEQVRALAVEGKNVVAEITMNSTAKVYLPLVGVTVDYFLFLTYVGGDSMASVLAWSEDAIQYLTKYMLTEDNLSNDEPLPAGTAAPGESRLVARADHVHPSELPTGAAANQQLVTDSDGSTKWEDRPGGYTSRFTGDYVYTKSDDMGAFHKFCQQNEYNIGDTLTVICNGTTYEDVPITDDGSGSVHLEQTDVFSFGNAEYYGGGVWGAKADTFPDGVTEITFKNVHQVNDVPIPVKYLPTNIEVDEMHLEAGLMSVAGGQLNVSANTEVRYLTADSFYVDEQVEFIKGQNANLLYDKSTSSLQLRNDWTYLRLARQGQLTLYYSGLSGDPHDVLVKGVRTPVDDTDAVNKEYVDSRVGNDYIILSSSTADSTKKFKITVDDTGTLTATEVTTTT